MQRNRTLCLYVTYYLSRYNETAYDSLGYGNMKETHRRIGEILDIKPATVKNMRDQFDPLHGYRAGWHQAPLSPSRQKVHESLMDLDEEQIRGIVSDILSEETSKLSGVADQLVAIASQTRKTKSDNFFMLRTATGKIAEEFFMNHYPENRKPVDGELKDCRHEGGGYDFRIRSAANDTFVEVKGLSELAGGILFTDKEWSMAIKHGKNFFLCIVSDLAGKPKITFIQNPARILSPKRNIYTSIQINWGVPWNQLATLMSG